jgi:hypothetical protein
VRVAGVVVTYRTLPNAADENARLVEAVFAELAARDPGGIRYATFRLEDGVSFVHAALLDDDRPNPLQGIAAFAAFQRDLGARVEAPPVASGAGLVGAYRLFKA